MGAVTGMAMAHIKMLYSNELNGLDADIIEDPVLMLCDNLGTVQIANSHKDIRSVRHFKRRLLYMRQLRKREELKYEHIMGVRRPWMTKIEQMANDGCERKINNRYQLKRSDGGLKIDDVSKI